ncbi:putative peroxisome biogenesis factor 10 [Cocos nucifera]|uniref:RING-type E3 ubiquitin transferase n=1 Tax=Cocos nucifera TaxID=13894 RepID=A0A8K0N1M6_COCNU|nr:putative peroxisome biogenesis factor 10 [Cocos nucifera]
MKAAPSEGGAGGEAGPSSQPPAPPVERRFPAAAQPEIMRAAEKDDHYAAFVHDACREAFRHLFGTRMAVAYQSEIKLLGQTLYYLLTTGAGQQTLGEEYCDISQVASSHGLPPTPARRALFIVYETIIPYLAERIRFAVFLLHSFKCPLYLDEYGILDVVKISGLYLTLSMVSLVLLSFLANTFSTNALLLSSSRMAARGIILADSQFGELYGSDHPRRDQVQSSDAAESSTSTSVPMSALSKFRERLHGLWLQAIQKWPTVLPYAREILQLALRTNLMFFYFEGLYYHISKRAAGIRYVFIGKPLNQRPRYQILGVFLLIQLCILGAEGLRRSNLSSITSSVHQTSPGGHHSSTAPRFGWHEQMYPLSQYSSASYSHTMRSRLLLIFFHLRTFASGIWLIVLELFLVKLNANRVVVGTLRGFDQFMNLVVDNTVEVNGSDKNDIGMVFVADGVFFAELNEVLTRELAEDGYSGVEVRVTPMRTEIIIRATRTQNVLGDLLFFLFSIDLDCNLVSSYVLGGRRPKPRIDVTAVIESIHRLRSDSEVTNSSNAFISHF